MFVKGTRWVKDYTTGDIYVEDTIQIVFENTVERKSYCDKCEAVKELGADACCGCAG
jgi:hypothetical protein